MKITSLKFDQKNWHLEETVFDNFNLLVGISGVGKTKILKIIKDIYQVATHHAQLDEGIKWKIGFIHAEQEYEWELKHVSVEEDFSWVNEPEQSSLIYEKIIKKEGDKKIVLLERSETSNKLDGKDIPKMNLKTESAIRLFSGETTIAPIFDGFKQLIFSETQSEIRAKYRGNPENINAEPRLGDLTTMPTVIKAYWFKKWYPDEFNRIKQDFTDIFTSVTDIKVNLTQIGAEKYEFSFNIKENNEWIAQSQTSLGMFRTLVHLIDISLAPPNSVIVIDEFENSLGINCLPELTDFIMSKAPHLQFILTTHHPYIISKIPYKTWKLVRRKGGYVSVINATDIPQLQTGSRLNKFIQLTHLPEYEEGIL